MSLRDSYFNGPNGLQQQMDSAFDAGITYVGAGSPDSSYLELQDRSASLLSAGSGQPGLYFICSSPTVTYSVWMLVAGEVAPTVIGTTPVQVTLASTDNPNQVAAKIAAALNNVSSNINGAMTTVFNATVNGDIVNIVNVASGVVMTPISTGTMGTTFASFSGTIAGTATPVTLTASKSGEQGNQIYLKFDGTITISDSIGNWNTSAPNNTVVLTAGVGTQVPTDGTVIALSGGDDGVLVEQVEAGINPTGNYLTLQSGLVSAAAQGLTVFTVTVQGTGSVNAGWLRANNGNNLLLKSFFSGIQAGLADQNIYGYQCRLILNVQDRVNTNVDFHFDFANASVQMTQSPYQCGNPQYPSGMSQGGNQQGNPYPYSSGALY